MATRKSTTTRKTRKPATKKADGPVIKILSQPEKPYRSGTARDLYWQACQEYEGRPLKEYIAFIEDPKTCPKIAPARVRTDRPPEKGAGWWGFFVRNGLVTTG